MPMEQVSNLFTLRCCTNPTTTMYPIAESIQVIKNFKSKGRNLVVTLSSNDCDKTGLHLDCKETNKLITTTTD